LVALRQIDHDPHKIAANFSERGHCLLHRAQQDVRATCFSVVNFIDLATTVSSKRRVLAKMRLYEGAWIGENQETVICSFMNFGRSSPPSAVSRLPRSARNAGT
jgi:hypothetical protein